MRMVKKSAFHRSDESDESGGSEKESPYEFELNSEAKYIMLINNGKRKCSFLLMFNACVFTPGLMLDKIPYHVTTCTTSPPLNSAEAQVTLPC